MKYLTTLLFTLALLAIPTFATAAPVYCPYPNQGANGTCAYPGACGGVVRPATAGPVCVGPNCGGPQRPSGPLATILAAPRPR